MSLIEEESGPGRPHRAWIRDIRAGGLLAEIPSKPGDRWESLTPVAGGRIVAETVSTPGGPRTVILWEADPDPAHPRLLTTLSESGSAAVVARDGLTCAILEGGRIVIFDTRTWKGNRCRSKRPLETTPNYPDALAVLVPDGGVPEGGRTSAQ
jgi:hypothetical protein